MPSLKELLAKSGVELPDDVDLNSLVESSDEVAGLKNKRDELLSWQSENKPVLDELKQRHEMLEAEKQKALQEREELAIKNKDFETLAELNAQKLAQLEERDKLRTEALKSSAHESAVESIASLFGDRTLGRDIAMSKVQVELNENGDPVTRFKLGDNTFDDFDSFKGAMAEMPNYSAVMQGPQSQTPSAIGGNGSSGAGSLNHKAEAAKKSGSSLDYLNAALSGE